MYLLTINRYMEFSESYTGNQEFTSRSNLVEISYGFPIIIQEAMNDIMIRKMDSTKY